MIGRIRGEVIEQNDETIVVDVSGVGYELRVSGAVLHSLVSSPTGNIVDLVVHTIVRETEISLYGFASSLEKRMFTLLQRVKGIGAKLALQIVSSIGVEQLLSAIGFGSTKELCSVPGVGKKTAERIIMELRELVSEFAGEVPLSTSQRLSDSIEVQSERHDAVLALEKLGFPLETAQRFVTQAHEELGSSATTEEVLHSALTKAM